MWKRPRRPYRNFGEFIRIRIVFFEDWQKRHEGRWPCLACAGIGETLAPILSVYEDRRSIRCRVCGGTGESTKEACRQMYRQAIDSWKKAAQGWDRIKEVRDKAIQRLTEEEVVALRLLGV